MQLLAQEGMNINGCEYYITGRDRGKFSDRQVRTLLNILLTKKNETETKQFWKGA